MKTSIVWWIVGVSYKRPLILQKSSWDSLGWMLYWGNHVRFKYWGWSVTPWFVWHRKKCLFPAKVRRSLLTAEDGEAQNGKAAEAYNCRMPHESRLAMASQRLTSSLEVIWTGRHFKAFGDIWRGRHSRYWTDWPLESWAVGHNSMLSNIP